MAPRLIKSVYTFSCGLFYNVLLYLRCSAKTGKINLMVFSIHVVLRSGAEIEKDPGAPSLTHSILFVQTHFEYGRIID